MRAPRAFRPGRTDTGAVSPGSVETRGYGRVPSVPGYRARERSGRWVAGERQCEAGVTAVEYRRSSSVRVAIDQRREAVLGLDAHDLLDLFTAGEEDERRDAADAVLGRERLIRVDVDLRDGRLGLGGQLLDDGGDHLAGATPVGVEVREHDALVTDESFEVALAVDRHRRVVRLRALIRSSICRHHHHVRPGRYLGVLDR